MSALSLLKYLSALVLPYPPTVENLPAVILRDLDVDTNHTLRSGIWQGRWPSSFQTHPISELTEYRDRLHLATFPSLGDKSA